MSIAQLSFPPLEVTRCEVCGFGEMQVDEVQSEGRLLLAECDRCDHRFTARLGSSRIPRPLWLPTRSEAEVATAA
jgi:hypothetical protein